MVVYKCENCVFSTVYKQVYTNHLKTQRHRDLQNLENTSIKYSECKKCSKKYKSYSAMWRHTKMCKKEAPEEPEEAPASNVPAELIEKMIISNNQLHNEFKEFREAQGKNAVATSNVTNHHNTTNYNNIHIYLNTRCSNAMTIDQFVDSMKFVKDDFNEIDQNRFYYQGATNILKKYFERLKPEDRPMHCTLPMMNKPAAFFVRDENEWKEECQSLLHYQMKYIEGFENKEEQLAVARFFEKFNEKLYETYKELSSSDKQMERRIHDKMMGGGFRDRIDMLDELIESKMLAVEVGIPPAEKTDPGVKNIKTNVDHSVV